MGIRVPDHPLTLRTLARLDTGVAAPSANRFGRVSPTDRAARAAGPRPDLDPARDLILDGGPTRVGVESTIIDCTGPAPRLLRPGAVGADQVESVTGLALAAPDPSVRAPGTLAAHYSPAAAVLLVADAGPGAPRDADPSIGLIAPAAVRHPGRRRAAAGPGFDRDYAAGLYTALREADSLGLREVRAVLPAGPGLARGHRGSAAPGRPHVAHP